MREKQVLLKNFVVWMMFTRNRQCGSEYQEWIPAVLYPVAHVNPKDFIDLPIEIKKELRLIFHEIITGATFYLKRRVIEVLCIEVKQKFI